MPTKKPSLLVIAAKAPIAGTVKTRLFPDLTPEAAADLYRCFLEDRIAAMRGLQGIELAIAYTPAGAAGHFSRLAGSAFRLFPQRGPDLSGRLADIFRRKMKAGYGAVAVIDSDSPDLPRALVEQAFERLSSGEAGAVFGPCEDGGYYLVGLREPHPELFRGIPWSTAGVLAKTLDIAAACGLKAQLLPRWSDLDTFADLLAYYRKYRERPPQRGEPGGRTFRFLAGLECIRRQAL